MSVANFAEARISYFVYVLQLTNTTRERALAYRLQTGEAENMSPKPKTIDAYLAALTPEKRTALDRLRKVIRVAAPQAEECISYGVPAFRLNGRFLVGLGAAAAHCSFYPGAVVTTLGVELKGYDTSKGTIRFQPNQPLPTALVRKLVKARIAKMGFARNA